jgi:Na+-driven multidrug efflux pump
VTKRASQSFGRTKSCLVAMGIAALANIPLQYGLIECLGVDGSALALGCSYLILACVMIIDLIWTKQTGFLIGWTMLDLQDWRAYMYTHPP